MLPVQADIPVRPKQLKVYAGLGKTKVYALVKEGRWPKPHKLGEAHNAPVFWWHSEIKEALRRLETDEPYGEPILRNKNAA